MKPNYRNIDLHAIARTAMAQYGFNFHEVSILNEELLLKSRRDNIKDLRSLLWSSIDNTESLDLDQLEYCEQGPGQEILVKVAIADVDSFVPKESQTDKYAVGNATSVYTGIEVFPMLPERLSTDLTSLRVAQDRLAVVIEFSVLADGDIRVGDIYAAIVCNKAKLVYEEIGEWLEGKKAAPLSVGTTPGIEEQLRLQDEAAKRLRKFRMEKGALELETIEARPVMQKETVAALAVLRKNPARYIIENFMIAANWTIMNFLGRAGISVIERVVRTPKNWAQIIDVAFACKDTLPPEPDSRALSKFLIRRKGADPESFADLSLTIVKLLGPGEYMMLEPGKHSYGHFGLAVMDYTHATAPNRRYVDIIIQRLLKSVLAKSQSPYTQNELIKYSAWCTDRDKASKKVERFMRKAMAAVLLSDRIGESFDAICTGSSEKGTYVRLISPPAEGRVMRREKGIVIGQKIRARLIGMDPYKGHINFERVD